MNRYDQDTAQRITDEVMKIANRNVSKDNREHRLEFFRYDDKGIWPANQFDSDSIEGKCLAWKPCHEFDRASGLNRPTTPGLPFPFTGRHLAAFMLRGVGALIADAFVDWEDGPISEGLALLAEDWDRSAIDAAFDAYRAAECAVGPFDKASAYRAQELEDSFLNTPVSLRTEEQREALHMAQNEANQEEAAWRKKMVNQLLAVEELPDVDSRSSEQVPLVPAVATAKTTVTPAPVEPASNGTAKPTVTGDRGWVMKRAALIGKHGHQWPTISRDFQDASENSLSIAAKAPGHGDWFEADALNWARQRGKLTETTGQQAPSPATLFGGLTHRIKG
jgi:hypothetical protein